MSYSLIKTEKAAVAYIVIENVEVNKHQNSSSSACPCTQAVVIKPWYTQEGEHEDRKLKITCIDDDDSIATRQFELK